MCSPCPGRIECTLWSLNGCPCFRSCTTKSDRRKTRLFTSRGAAPKCTLPNARSAIRTASTMALNSCGSSENALSGPGSDRESVRCFSMMQAPRATAATGTAIPIVWSDKPTGTSNFRASSGIVRRFMSSGEAGYALVHLSNAICVAPAVRAMMRSHSARESDARVEVRIDLGGGVVLHVSRS